MKLEARVDKLEAAVVNHLEESGFIRADIEALKKVADELKDVPAIVKRVEKAFWIVFIAVVGVIVSNYWSRPYDLHHDLPQMQQKP